jgi:hypothetical protein
MDQEASHGDMSSIQGVWEPEKGTIPEPTPSPASDPIFSPFLPPRSAPGMGAPASTFTALVEGQGRRQGHHASPSGEAAGPGGRDTGHHSEDSE